MLCNRYLSLRHSWITCCPPEYSRFVAARIGPGCEVLELGGLKVGSMTREDSGPCAGLVTARGCLDETMVMAACPNGSPGLIYHKKTGAVQKIQEATGY